MIDRETLLREIGQGVKEALKLHRSGDVPPQLLRELADDEGCSEQTQCFLAAYPETPSRVLEGLYESSSFLDVLKALANNPRTPKTILQGLAKHDAPDVRMTVAQSRYISPQTASILSEDPDAFVRAALASNPVLTPRVQAEMSNDEVPFVRTSLLKSPRLDEEMYTALADDQDSIVQAASLLSPRVPEDTLLQWADKDEYFAQAVLMQRKNLPPKVLESLCFSDFVDIQEAAMARKTLTLDEMLGFAQGGEEAIRIRIASMPTLHDVVQQVLLHDKSHEVLMALAGCQSITGETAEALIATGDADIIGVLSRNDSVPTEALLKLADCGDTTVLKNLAGRECPQAVLDAIYATDDDEILYHLAYNGIEPVGMPMALLMRLLESELPTLRALAASSPDLPLQQMGRLAGDPSPTVRLALAHNRAVPLVALETLAEDPDAKVRNAVKNRKLR